MRRIGIISDTHGMLRSQVNQYFSGCDLILHAGDIGKEEVLRQLQGLAPVKAVRGNVDRDGWSERLPWIEHVEFDGLKLILVHDIHTLTQDMLSKNVNIAVSGHSHRSKVFESQGVLFINPGSAGPRRFRLPVSLALLEVVKGELIPKLIELEI